MYKKDFSFLVKNAQAAIRPVRVAIAGADAENILLGAFRAEEEGFARPILLGNREKIEAMLRRLELISRDYELIEVPEDASPVQRAIELIHEGKADALMRGNTQTRDFLMPILDKKNDLIQPGRLLTHINLMKLPDYERILAISDVTIIPNPDIRQRKEIVRNMAALLRKLGYEKPNIAVLALAEKPLFRVPDTVEAETIVRDHQEHPIANCNLVGPIAYDLIISAEAARLKGYDCPYCGAFDGIVTQNLMTGNLLVKALEIHGHASSFGVIEGAKIPIAISSRSDPAEKSYLALAVCASVPPVD